MSNQIYPAPNPLIRAAAAGVIEKVRELIPQFDVNEICAPGPCSFIKAGTALSYAVHNWHAEIVKMLVAAGADINARGEGCNTALTNVADRASGGGGWNAVTGLTDEQGLYFARLLIELGADLNIADGESGSALAAAAATSHAVVVNLLIESGADVNVSGNDGWTPLMRGAWVGREGHVEIVRMLLDAGADITAKNHEGLTALDVAEKTNHPEIVAILSAAQAHRAIAEVRNRVLR